VAGWGDRWARTGRPVPRGGIGVKNPGVIFITTKVQRHKAHGVKQTLKVCIAICFALLAWLAGMARGLFARENL